MDTHSPFYLYRFTHDATGFYYYAVSTAESLASKKLRDNLQPTVTAKAKPERKHFYQKLVDAKVIDPKATMKVNIQEWSVTTVFGPSNFPICHALRKELVFVATHPGYLIHQTKH